MKEESGRRKRANPVSDVFVEVTMNNPNDLKSGTKRYALDVIRLYVALPKSTEAQVMGKQLLRSGTSVGAHYREGQRAKSNADLISKLEGALQELEESGYWLELLEESGTVEKAEVAGLANETGQLIAMLTVAVQKIKAK